MDKTTSLSDEYFIELAIKEAKKAYKKDEVPIGAVLVLDNKVIAKAHNTSEHGKNALEHAEIKVMNKASKILKQKRLWDCVLYVTIEHNPTTFFALIFLDCVLYVTIEPCTMCATAISMMRIKKLVYGASNPKGGGVESGVKFFEQPTCFHAPKIVSKIKEKETSSLLKDFFKNKR